MINFLVGILIGLLVSMFVIYASDTNKRSVVEKRCIEVNAGTYEAGQFKHTDDKVKYILTGKK